MRRIPSLQIALLVTLFCAAMTASSAQAQATRTWVSGVGDDVNPCSRTAPCKTFAGAISKTAAAGEINCLDPGGFGGVTITKSLSIICDAGTAGVLVSGTNGITVNVASTDFVLLRGLEIQGVGTGLDGVKIIGGGNTMVSKCIIQGFTGNGVNVAGTANAVVTIDETTILKNGIGVTVGGQGNVTNIAFIRNSTIEFNATYSTNPAAGSTIILNASVLSGTAVSINNGAGGNLISYGNNVIRGSGAPTSTVMFQ